MRNITAFAGPARVGKTTAARILQEELGGVCLSFAGPLKEAAVALTGLDMRMFTDQYSKLIPLEILGGKTPRKFMQLLGTEFVREMVNPNFWESRMADTIRQTGGRNIYIDDVRFNDECRTIKQLGGIVIELRRVTVPYESNHKSEMGLSDPNYVIHVPELDDEYELKKFLLTTMSVMPEVSTVKLREAIGQL